MDQGGFIEPIPITEEDKVCLDGVRSKVLQKWKTIAIIGSVASIITIGFGTVQISMSGIGLCSFGGQ